MMKKNKLIVITTACLMLCFSFFASCSFLGSNSSSASGVISGDSSSGTEEKSSITITNKKTVLNLGDEYQLSVDVKNIDADVIWTSDSPDTISVSSDGNLTAKALGSATITAAAGDYFDSVSITVEDSVQPILSSGETETVSLLVGGTYTASPTVTYNGSVVEDIDFIYGVDDDTVATVGEDGTVTALKAGTCVITISAEYRYHNLTASYTVEVSESKFISLSANGVSLYTYTVSDEKTTEQLTAELNINGSILGSENITWTSSDDTVATVENGLITAVSKGKATITAKYVNEETETDIEALCYVTVEKTSAVIEEAFTIELNKEFKLPASEIEDFTASNVISVKEGGVECLVIETSDGTDESAAEITKKLDKNVLVGSPDAKTLVVETSKVVYTVSATVYNAIIETASDLNALQENLSRHDRSGDASAYGYYYDGYVLFSADIDYNGAAFEGICVAKHLKPAGSSASTPATTNGFAGIIDGDGHTIKNMTVGDGFVGNLIKQETTGTIKNLTFDGIIAKNRAGACVAQSIAAGVIENVTVKGKVEYFDSIGKYQAMGAVTAVINSAASIYKNVTVIYDGVMKQPANLDGTDLCLVTVFGRMGGNYTSQTTLFENCHVIGADESGKTLPLFGCGLTEPSTSSNVGTGYTPYTEFTGITVYATMPEYLLATGWTLKESEAATCTSSGYATYQKEDEEDYTIHYSALGHDWNDEGSCNNCPTNKNTVIATETDVRTGFDFATLSSDKTISSIICGEQTLSGTVVTFEIADASQTVKTYEVNYTDGSVAVVNLTVWSLLMESEADMRLMKDYVVKVPVAYQTGATQASSDYYQYVGYFKLTKDIAWSNTNWTQSDGIVDNSTSWIKTFATQGFYGIIDGDGHTITGFRTVGNHTGLVNVLGTGGVIKNLTFNHVTIYGGASYHGIIAGYAHGGTIENVTINGVDMSGSNAPATVLVGSFCIPNAGKYYNGAYKFPAVITGVNIKNVTINAVDGSFGAEFGETVSALGEIETSQYTGEFADLPLPKCEGVTINGASIIIKNKDTSETYAEWTGVNGTTENESAE